MVGKKLKVKGLLFLALVAISHSFASNLDPVGRHRQARRGADTKFSVGNAKTTMGSSSSNDNEKSDSRSFNVQTWNPLRLLVLKLGLTEPMGTSPLNYGKYDGVFTCAYCGEKLFDSSAKYDSGSGWPSFWRSAEEDSLDYKMEFGGRLECRCKKCSRCVWSFVMYVTLRERKTSIANLLFL